MEPQDVQKHVRQQPFVPFVIHMNDGRSYEVRHPEMAIVDLRVVHVATRVVGEFAAERVFCSIQNIASIEQLDEVQSGQSSNGD